ncbi:Cys-tRNA(Pro) deacylase [Gallaecimonas kandeliae]|uniref:Cys-tRNA(Pro) deacylase n=1 Tax=Gallaecimonas kandeliae TaxID=3029055 RepID=UPI00264A46B8|nr:Cys-tRNA(Pro) deacylase [Gallaecimonas kandeliae]WKE64069.1 Cys-tRNA(Pro) deacylase [Gallaecimonas kandeliae]
MTPAIVLLQKTQTPHQVLSYQHDPKAPAYGLEAAEVLGLAVEQVFKTLLAKLDDGKLVVALVPVHRQLDLKLLAKAAGAKKAQMAPPHDAEKATGYVVGGISPLGQKKALPLFLDDSAKAFEVIHVSGGRRGLELALAPEALCALTRGRFASLGKD